MRGKKTSCLSYLLIMMVALTGCATAKGDSMRNQLGLEIPTIEEASDYVPEYYDGALAKEKGLSENEHISKHYLELQAVYRLIFENYIEEVLSLKDYDEELENSELNFIEVAPEKQGFYQKYDLSDLKYLSLRNNLQIEKLSEREIEYLENLSQQESIINTDEINTFVEQTYKTVITITQLSGTYDIVYEDAIDGKKIAENDALILEISTMSEFDAQGNYVDQANENAKDEYLTKLASRMESELTGHLEVPVAVFVNY